MGMTKAETDKAVRSAGEVLIDFSELVATSGNSWIGTTEVDGKKRFFEIKITAKKEDFSDDDLQTILNERTAVETRKAETKAAAQKKKAADEKRRAEAKAKKEKGE